MVWACDEKRGRRVVEMEVQRRRKKGRWMGRVRRDCPGRKCTTVIHGDVCHRTSTTHKTGDNLKKKNQ